MGSMHHYRSHRVFLVNSQHHFYDLKNQLAHLALNEVQNDALDGIEANLDSIYRLDPDYLLSQPIWRHESKEPLIPQTAG